MERSGVDVRFGALLAIGQKTLMKHNNSLGNLFGKRQDKENLLWNPVMNQFWNIPETKALIVVWVTHKSTTLAAHIF